MRYAGTGTLGPGNGCRTPSRTHGVVRKNEPNQLTLSSIPCRNASARSTIASLPMNKGVRS